MLMILLLKKCISYGHKTALNYCLVGLEGGPGGSSSSKLENRVKSLYF